MYSSISFLGIEISFFIKQCPLRFTFGNKRLSAKAGTKLLSYLAIFRLFSIRFPQINQSSATKIFNVLFSWYKH